MPATVANWIYEQKSGADENSRRALRKAKTLEEQRIEEGWRWIEINPRTKVFVPCDKKGRPTKDGQRRIREMESRL